MRDSSGRPISLRRRLALGLMVSVLSLFFFFALMEGALRLSGFGRDTCFYRTVHDKDGDYYRENRWFAAPYFARELIRRPPPMRLEKDKSADCCRIFVLGGSAAMGDPEASFSMARVLETMLREAYPEVRFEVVNAALTAINSHVVRRIAADCANLKPDLFIVYAGNNEVIGPFGPAAVLAPFLRSRTAANLVTALRGSRTGQFLSGIVRMAGGKAPMKEWGGMEMFLRQAFRESDPRLEAVRQAFAANLRSIVRSGTKAGAHTLLCTVIVNGRDFAPFLSLHREGLDAVFLGEWNDFLKQGDALLASGDSVAALARYGKAWAIDDTHADLAYRMGRASLAEGDAPGAARFLQRAVDLDALRFRTDSHLNGAIRSVARTGAGDCELVDLAQAAAVASRGGVPGDDLLYEHVHLTMTGNYLAAAELFKCVGADLVRRGRIRQVAQAPLSIDEVRRRLAYTPCDQAMIIQDMLGRFAKPPFNSQGDHAAWIDLWNRRAERARELLQMPGCRDAVIAQYEVALTLRPDDWWLRRNFGMALVYFGENFRAAAELERADAFIGDDPDTLFALATALRLCSEGRRANGFYARLRELEPEYPGLPPAGR